MMDLRPVGYVIGLLTAVLGCAMIGPLLFDLAHGDPEWHTFMQSAVITISAGLFTSLACANGKGHGLNLRQSFILTTGVWIALPTFGAIPFIIGETQLSLVDAMFESMSGMTTTGATAIEGLETHSYGILLWRAILQWLGGLGIVIVAMIFLPVMKVGGMQFFQSEGFDTLGKSLPRALDIAKGLLQIYIGLTIVCALGYIVSGMSTLESIVHSFTTIATGGYSTTDASFAAFPGAPQYVASLFMFLASVPFIRFLQMIVGDPKPLFQDMQLRGYLTWSAYAVALIVVYRMSLEGEFTEEMFRSTLFNVVSIFSGTGYGDGDVMAWGPFAFAILFCVGMIGGCSGSTGCSIKVFRYQIMLRAISAQIKRLYSPNRVVSVRFEGRSVSDDVMSSIMLLFTCFVLTFGILIVLMGMTGISFLAAVTGAWTSIFNIGPVFGPEVGPSGAIHLFPDTAKWLMIVGMLLGRLEIVSVLVLVLPRFWRA
ncbi:potassium transporter TrkH [Marivivens niveibacter]|uniref:Trk system potassium uptake protein n=1 Tax=Marivivens niveibacter TaxID=1930667 RepID=A0A251X1B5_9RHOB|nr:TrkH family potassium uptake protein [Marivivens niveibacter]OUD10402.1 potassium transporter TrkH [Marivivens niveibacter]